MSRSFITGVIGLSLLLFSCSKNEAIEEVSVPLEEGIYTGTYTVKRFAGMPGEYWGPGNWTTTLILNNGKYTITTGGSGNYSINNGKIIFEDENVWTCDFDSNLILNGVYEYTFDGRKLKILQRFDFAHYVYDLKKE